MNKTSKVDKGYNCVADNVKVVVMAFPVAGFTMAVGLA